MSNPQKALKYMVVAFAWLVVLYPLYERARYLEWAFDKSLLLNLFPMFGLTAFSILWLHVVSGVFEPWLRNIIDFEAFVRNTSFIVFWSILLHPLLLFFTLDWRVADIFLYGTWGVALGIIGWLLLITYDIGKMLKHRKIFRVHWPKILFVSTIGIIVIFFHSLLVGSDLQSGPLRAVWIFYGVTAIFATVYNFFIKKFSWRN